MGVKLQTWLRTSLMGAVASLSACASGPPKPSAGGQARPPIAASQHLPSRQHADGLGGRTAAMLVSLFGPPALDLREGSARKLQFLNSSCVLDAYLYPPREQGEAVVTHVDARLPDGRDADGATCIASLHQR